VAEKIKIPCKILNKRTHEGICSFLFGSGPTHYITVRLYTHEEDEKSPLKRLAIKTHEVSVDMDTFYSLTVGEKYLATLYVHSDGLLYFFDED
jgi:hypothetical protein